MTKFFLSFVLLGIVGSGCHTASRHASQVNPESPWLQRIDHFQWSSSPKESIARLETLARDVVGPHVCIIAPKVVDKWMRQPDNLVDQPLGGLVYMAVQGLFLNYCQVGDTIIMGMTVEDAMTWRSLILNVKDAETGLSVTNLMVEANTLIPSHVTECGGTLFVSLPVMLPFINCDGMFFASYQELYKDMPLQIGAPGYESTVVQVGTLGDENIELNRTVLLKRVKVNE